MSRKTGLNSNNKISDTMRDYLAEIYRLGHGKAWVSNTAIADELDVSSPAAVRMVRRLDELGLVEHVPYQGVKLLKTGEKVALLSIRRHRLVERFLVNQLQFGWHEVHDQADSLQKGINQILEDRIDMLMGYPKTCPHGDPIPTKDGVMPLLGDKPLKVVPPGSRGKISRVRERHEDKLQYMGSIGLVPGAKFELISRAPFDGPLRLKLDRNEQVIGHELASSIWVISKPPIAKE
ncbi:metal-dependent transcriptional regulator [Anaerolineales bacterium HSG6]|nr:metal-dependent transcriptional regulator [Anaerolineales bacterium HSG6]MDM8532997.1 metal-dependent transcriptional regulator [Anaerolineales bacterium HSG25]